MLDRQLHNLQCLCKPIEDWWSIRHDVTLIDVRSQSEFQSGSIPGAINVQLLSDDERADIGKIWKKLGHDGAVKRGYEYGDISYKTMLQSFESLPKDKPIFVYCARGGLRSRIACNLIKVVGREPILITGGYKRYRRFCASYLEDFGKSSAEFIVLNGLTGSGKTLILENMANALDLEGCANHSGSAFGHIGNGPSTTKNFEAAIVHSLAEKDSNKPIFVEAESRQVGRLTIPLEIWAKMKAAPQVEITAPLDIRVGRMLERYVFEETVLLEELFVATSKLERFFSKARFNDINELLDQKKYRELGELLLVEHYDKKYRKLIEKNIPISTIPGIDPVETARLLEQKYN